MTLTLRVNGNAVEVHEAEPWESLLFVLRERLGLYAAKNACEQGECGSCSVFVDGELVCACLVMAMQVEGRAVVTPEGLTDPLTRSIRDAFVECGSVQCGFCTPGFIVAARDLLARTDAPSVDQIREHLSGNLCRCTGYTKIVDAVQRAAGDRAGEALGGGSFDELGDERG